MFHVPECGRIVDGEMGSDRGVNAGAFIIDSVEPGWVLYLICDDGRCPGCVTDWEHVSVRAHKPAKWCTQRPEQSRVPTWREMAHVKGVCWDDDDVVMQLHPRRADYVNRHPHVLHLWRPTRVPIPTPPIGLV